jgi:CheY-like chemotaxis protein
MFNKTEISDHNNSINISSEETFNKSRKTVLTSSIIALFCLIFAIILIIFNQRLIAGFLIFSGAVASLFIVNKTLELNKKFKESFVDFSLLNKKKDDVITDFSHKMREPLNNLVSIVDILIESDLQKKQKDLIETFIASTNNMVTTVNELTMKSAGNLSFERRKNIRFNLSSTIQNTIELYTMKGKVNIDYIFDKKKFSDFECLGDPIILKQIILDLFNTIENQESERATKVRIDLQKVKITGTENIFALRIQTDNSIILINDSGDERSLSSRLIISGKGTYTQEIGNNSTILNIILPFNNQVAEPKPNTASPKIEELKKKEKTHKELKDLKILLVEDNMINQKITLLTLKPLVYSIDTASNGKEALDKFGTSSYDLILMDIQMPIMNGLLAAEKIRTLESVTNSHVPIIAITANAMIGDKEKCISAGIDDYISKPFKPSALIDKILPFI